MTKQRKKTNRSRKNLRSKKTLDPLSLSDQKKKKSNKKPRVGGKEKKRRKNCLDPLSSSRVCVLPFSRFQFQEELALFEDLSFLIIGDLGILY